MEREGKGEGEVVGRRRGGEKMRGRGIIVGGIALLLVLGCNNGAIEELEKKNQFLSSLANLGNDFLGVFTSFGDMFSATLGFKADSSKKADVGKYFKSIEISLTKTKTTLEKIVNEMKRENNPNAESTDVAVKKLVSETLDNIIQGAKTASEAIGTVDEPLGDVAVKNTAGVKSEDPSVKSFSEGIGKIVNVVLGKEGNAEAGDANNSSGASRSATAATDGEAGKLFITTGTGAAGSTAEHANKVAADAAKAVGAVTGADILRAISKGDSGKAALLAKNSGGTVTANDATKDAVLAGGIVLRAMAKGGKFANGNTSNDVATAIKGVAITAVNKALDTLTIAIRKTIDEGLKTVKDAMNINANDNPVKSETGAAK